MGKVLIINNLKPMQILYLPKAEKELKEWNKNDPNMLEKINKLIDDIRENPYSGIGKPEALKGDLTGKWSRRIDSEDRLIYSVDEKNKIINIYSLRYHYEL